MHLEDPTTFLSAVRGKLPLVLYELNEVPWRVIDWYAGVNPDSEIAALMQHATTFTTETRDEGELHPWTTWPSLHRGAYNTQHRIFFLNQDKSCASRFPPVWEVAATAGLRVGVFGSLQSYPVPQAQQYAFYVPDTFAPGPETHPPRYSPFQRFNLRQTRADGAVASDVKIDGAVLADVIRLPGAGVTLRTFGALALHLLKEKLNPLHRVRRPLMQPLVEFDVFRDALRRYRPDFCTFFTNHVASVMHRYWKYTFPEDFGFVPSTRSDTFHSQNIRVAMDIADRQIGELRKHVDTTGGQLVIASSMGQEAVERGEYKGELRIDDVRAFARAIGFIGSFKNHLAMQPDFNFEFDSAADTEEFCAKAARVVDTAGNSVWYRFRREGKTVNLGLLTPPDLLLRQSFVIMSESGASTDLPFDTSGVRVIQRDVGTGYHQPYGSLIWYQRDLVPSTARSPVESAAVKQMILEAIIAPLTSMSFAVRTSIR